MLGNELLRVLPVPESTAASAVFIGASLMNLFEPKRRARVCALPLLAMTGIAYDAEPTARAAEEK